METNPKDTLHLVVETHLREYDALREEILKRLEIESQIQLYTIAAIGGVIPLVQYIDSVSSRGGDANILLVLAAIVFIAFGWHQIELENTMVEIGIYLRQILAPKLKALMSEIDMPQLVDGSPNDFFEWESNYRIKRVEHIGSLRESWLMIGNLGKHGVAPLTAMVLLAYYVYYEHIFLAKPWSFDQSVLVLTVAFGIVWILVSGFIMMGKYAMRGQLLPPKK